MPMVNMDLSGKAAMIVVLGLGAAMAAEFGLLQAPSSRT